MSVKEKGRGFNTWGHIGCCWSLIGPGKSQIHCIVYILSGRYLLLRSTSGGKKKGGGVIWGNIGVFCGSWDQHQGGKKRGGLLEVILGTAVPLEFETPCPFIYSLSIKSIPIQFELSCKNSWFPEKTWPISTPPLHLRFAFYFNYKILWLPRITILITWPYGLL